MRLRKLWKWAGLCLAGLLWAGGGAQGAQLGKDRPNIIFILADDLGYGDLGVYGQEQIKTPNLDRMAREGMRFKSCYAGSTVCAPSRSSLMTGQHTGHTRIRGNARHPLKPEDVTVAEVLKQAGYRTALVGKWGLGEAGSSGTPNRQGFDEFFGYLNQRHAHNYYPSFLWRDDRRVPLRNVVPNEDAEGAGVATSKLNYTSDLFTAEALSFLRRNKDQRFFLYLAYTIPHANNEAKAQGMEVPSTRPYTRKKWPEPEKNKAAMITRLDRDVGRLMRELKGLGLDRKTIVFFSSDNGPHKEGGHNPNFFKSSGRLRGIKRDLYEGGIRVPMIVRWPGRIKPHVSDQVWAFWDFLPTAAELAGARTPSGVDGISMAPVLLGKPQKQHEYLYWEFHEQGFKQAMRMGDWKGVRLRSNAPLELYNLKADEEEKKDVAKQNPDVVEAIEARFQTARTESEHWPIVKTGDGSNSRGVRP